MKKVFTYSDRKNGYYDRSLEIVDVSNQVNTGDIISLDNYRYRVGIRELRMHRIVVESVETVELKAHYKLEVLI